MKIRIINTVALVALALVSVAAATQRLVPLPYLSIQSAIIARGGGGFRGHNT